MTTIGRDGKIAAAMALVVAWAIWPGTTARGQVAYTPQVASILNGAALQATPVVSADRRYVRLTLNPYFNTVNGFSTYTAPLGAVSGGGIGGGGIGGIGGGGGAGAAGGGGNVGFAGMGGPIVGGFGMPGTMMSMPGMSMPGMSMTMPGMMTPMPEFGPGRYRAGDFPPATAGMAMGGMDGPIGPQGFAPMGDAAANPGGQAADPAGALEAGTFDPFDRPEARRPTRPRATKRATRTRRSTATRGAAPRPAPVATPPAVKPRVDAPRAGSVLGSSRRAVSSAAGNRSGPPPE